MSYREHAQAVLGRISDLAAHVTVAGAAESLF